LNVNKHKLYLKRNLEVKNIANELVRPEINKMNVTINSSNKDSCKLIPASIKGSSDNLSKLESLALIKLIDEKTIWNNALNDLKEQASTRGGFYKMIGKYSIDYYMKNVVYLRLKL
jgi:hypothetical protein